MKDFNYKKVKIALLHKKIPSNKYTLVYTCSQLSIYPDGTVLYVTSDNVVSTIW